MKIPFNRPFIAGKELFYISQAVLEGRLAGDGRFTKNCQKWIEENLKCKKVLLTHSCTAALEMAAVLSEIDAGDEVIMPSFTFVSTANAFVMRGGKPVFVDIRSDTLNIDENIIEAAITEKTKVIVPVHYAGEPCEMEKISELAKKHKLLVIEDAAQGMFAGYKGRFLGTIGDIGCLSFHETKNVISGEGGAILINNDSLIERAEIIREKGTNRSKFFRGQVDKYTWIDVGSSYLPSELIGAFLFAQLENSEKVTAERVRIYNKYYDMLKPLEEKGYIRLPYSRNSSNGHIFYILTESLEERTELISFLKEQDILAVFHYVPLHSSPAGRKFGRVHGEMVNTDNAGNKLLRLPLFYEITDEMIEKVADSVFAFYRKYTKVR
ncbi:MAG: dTDP-4-amino-4,6-dideoxygalactose transaminase [Candidatus Riflebacteria bacterium]|nr:dTDP-4-amino-4,6-dideoxygalactose transaminase [Candidatus Riflebacteria bacterium]